jgi:hypothetical protein
MRVSDYVSDETTSKRVSEAMIEISTNAVCWVVAKAREFHAKVQIVEPDPGSNPSDDGMRSVLEDYSDDPVRDEINEFIASLSEGEQIELVALTWLGRETHDDLASAKAEARDSHNDRTADYLLGIPLVADYLEEGLSQLGLSCEDFNLGR